MNPKLTTSAAYNAAYIVIKAKFFDPIFTVFASLSPGFYLRWRNGWEAPLTRQLADKKPWGLKNV
jgi:hypothetical protein